MPHSKMIRSRFISKYILLLLLLSSSIVANSQSETEIKEYIDSMTQIVHTATGKEKLEALDAMAVATFVYRSGLPCIDMFEQEAKKQSDKIKLGNAYCYKVNYHFWVTLFDDSVLYYIDKAESIGYDRNANKMDRLRFVVDMTHGRYSLALYQIQKTLKDGFLEINSADEAIAYIDLSYVFKKLENYDEAILASQKAIDILNYLDINHNRDELAAALGTNRQYLIDAIRVKTGKTYKDYINSIRLDFAYQTLIKDWGASIESIYVEAGFISRSTFNRQFRDAYGMTPAELREVAKQKSELVMDEMENIQQDNKNI